MKSPTHAGTEPPHGSNKRYRRFGCRCDICVKNNYARLKAYRNGKGRLVYSKTISNFYRRNKDKVLEAQRRYHRNNPSKRLIRLYGIDFEQFERMRMGQNNACAICKVSFETTKPAVDHCHETGKVRGLLCDACNRGLGAFKDCVESLLTAAGYLRR